MRWTRYSNPDGSDDGTIAYAALDYIVRACDPYACRALGESPVLEVLEAIPRFRKIEERFPGCDAKPRFEQFPGLGETGDSLR